MLAAVTLLASCQKSDLDGINDGGMVDVTLSASLSEASATTRADYTAGDGTTANRCILEVYTGGKLYKRMVAPVEDFETSFELRLVSSQEYEFLLWADKSLNDSVAKAESTDSNDTTENDKYYETNNGNGLKAIPASYTDAEGDPNYAGNDETRDAFYYADTKRPLQNHT